MFKKYTYIFLVLLCSNSESMEKFVPVNSNTGRFLISIINTSNCVYAIDESQIKKPIIDYIEKLDPNKQGFNVRPNHFAQIVVDFDEKYYGPEFLYIKKDEEIIGTFKFMLKENRSSSMCLAIDGDELKSFIVREDLGIVIRSTYSNWDKNVIQILKFDPQYRYTNRRGFVACVGCDGTEFPIEEPEDGDTRPLYKEPRGCMPYLFEGMLNEAEGDKARPVHVRHGRIEKPHGCCSIM